MDTPLDAKEVGKELFGRPCRLALALWIAGLPKSRFYQSEPPREVIKPATAYVLTSVLQSVVEEGTGKAAHKLGRLWKFKLTEVDDWVRAGGAQDVDDDAKGSR